MIKCVLADRRLLVFVAWLIALSGGVPSYANDAEDLAESLTPAEGGLIDLPMYRDPVLEMPEHTRAFHPRLQSLWLEALAREEAHTRLEAARAFGEAAGRGMTDLDAAAARLIEVVRDDESEHVAQAAAEALRAMDHADAAAAMLDRAQSSRRDDFVLTTDRMLAAWDHEPARAWWAARLEDASASRRQRISAIRALSQVRATSADALLRDLALSGDESIELRLAASDALGRVADAGMVEDAGALAAAEGASVVDRLVAARMLAGHGDDAALSLAEQWTEDDDATVARRAMANLNAHDRERAAALAPTLLSHADANVRLEALRAVASQQTAEAVVVMADQFDDVAPALRTFARRTLEGYAQDTALNPIVREQIERILASDASWRSLEQAALLSAVLDHKPMAVTLAALLTHDRPEVRRAAANAMRVLEVRDTLPAIQARIEQLSDMNLEAPEASQQASEEAPQLFHAIGQMRHMPADETLRRYIPKNSGYASTSRSAAIWALGHLHEGEARPDVARALIGRVTDQSIMQPEAADVQRFAAITLGRLDASDHVDALREIYQSQTYSDELRVACRWAIEQLTGEDLAPLEPQSSYISGWFLEPLD
ncbi:MAG: hypothetical protein WD118_00160 [Phycisphaeraceae bacterium]